MEPGWNFEGTAHTAIAPAFGPQPDWQKVMDDVGLPIASAFVSALTECTSTVLSEIAVNTTPDDALLQKEFHLRKIHDNVMAGGEQAAVQRSTAFAVYAHSSERKVRNTDNNTHPTYFGMIAVVLFFREVSSEHCKLLVTGEGVEVRG